MKPTGIKVTPVSVETMLNDKENAAYNPAIWKESVNRYAKYQNVQFYISPKNDAYAYDRFFVSYTIPEGLNFLSQWNAFSAGLTSNGFKRAFINNGEIFTNGFGEDGKQCVTNSKEGRKWMKDNLCKYGVLVTNCL